MFRIINNIKNMEKGTNTTREETINTPNNNSNKHKKIDFSKIIRGPTFSAYKRKNLGCIPSKFDNFIFHFTNNISKSTKSSKPKITFSNSILKNLTTKNSENLIEVTGKNTIKFIINNNLLFNQKNDDLKNNLIFNTNNCQKFLKEDRKNNIYYKQYYLQRYYPGPGDYDTKNDNINIYRYNSLFKNKSSFALIEENEFLKSDKKDLGPGCYNIGQKLSFPPGGEFSKLKKYDNFNNPFPEKKRDENYKFYIPSNIKIKNINKNNYFFINKKSHKKENIEEKIGLIRSNSDILIPKKIENKLKIKSGFRKIMDFDYDWIDKNLNLKINEEIIKNDCGEYSNKNNSNILKDYIDVVNEEKNVKSGKNLFSFPKEPKFFSPKNMHVPGPSYYEPERILDGIKLKKEFNQKIGYDWV